MTRSLSRPDNRGIPEMGSGAPRGERPETREQREAIRDHLRGTIGVPNGLVERRIDTMTLAERVYCEIDMLREAKVMHSYDYDPFAGGR